MANKDPRPSLQERRVHDSGAAGLDQGTHRFYDSRYNAWMVKVMPGAHYITRDPDEIIVTVLGSCVAACIRDPKTGIGGMNHFMLPGGRDRDSLQVSEEMRYGHYAMEVLINGILSTGCPRERLEIKVFGGGNVIVSTTPVGGNNADFVHKYLADEGLRPVVSDLGGNYPRRIEYQPSTGKVKRLLLKRQEDKELLRDEVVFKKRLAEKRKPQADDIELFG